MHTSNESDARFWSWSQGVDDEHLKGRLAGWRLWYLVIFITMVIVVVPITGDVGPLPFMAFLWLIERGLLTTWGDIGGAIGWSPGMRGIFWSQMRSYSIWDHRIMRNHRVVMVTFPETNIAHHSPYKWIVGILFSYWGGLFSGLCSFQGGYLIYFMFFF